MEDLISNHEKNYIIDGMQEELRNDGRRLTDYRPISLEMGVLPGSNGSARVQIGATEVLVAVKAELTTVEKGEVLDNRLRFFVDISANCSPKFVGRGGNELGEELARTLHTAYDNQMVLADLGKLVLAPSHFWALYVDILVLQYDGNMMDTISIGVKAALSDTEICTVIVRPADEGKVVIDLPGEASTWQMDISSAPLVVAVNRIGDQCVFDAEPMEELCSNSTLYIGVRPDLSGEGTNKEDEESLVTCVKKVKGGSLEIESIGEMLEKTIEVAKKLNSALMRKIQVEERTTVRS